MATWFVYYLPDHVFVPWITRKLNKRSTFSVTDIDSSFDRKENFCGDDFRHQITHGMIETQLNELYNFQSI